MIARVFPRRTNATPTDEYAFIGDPPIFYPDDITEVHISVAFTWDIDEGYRLLKAWDKIAPSKIGGPALNAKGENFTPGRYLKSGYIITSRGCPNDCWFCVVPKREGREIRELPITSGYNVLDDNLLACSESHIKAVFKMLSTQETRPMFTGGIEAKRLKPWHVELFKQAKTQRIYFAYDTPDDWDPLAEAARLFKEADYLSHAILSCYVLVGFHGDTFDNAEARLTRVLNLGICPMAMLYRDHAGKTTREWRRFQRAWARPSAIYATNRNKDYMNSLTSF